MGYDGSLKFDTAIDEKGFNSGVKKLGNIAKTGLGTLTKAVGVASAALGAGVAMGVKYNSEMQNYFSDFKVMLGSAEAATKYVDSLKKMAAATPFEMTDLANASKILLAFGSDAETAQSQLQMLGDISLGNSEKMNTLATAFGRIQSNGRASMEELNMMIDAGFNPLNIIAQQTGESMENLRKRVSDGGVSFEEIAQAMQIATSQGGQFYKGMEEASKTLSGQFSTLKDNVNNLLGEMTSGVTDTLTNKLVPGAIDSVNKLTEAFETDGFSGLVKTGASIVSNLAQGLASNVPDLLQAGADLINSLLDSLSTSPERAFGIAGVLINNFGEGFVAAIPEFLPKILDFIQGIGDKLAEAAPVIIQKGFELLGYLVDGIVAAVPILIEKVPGIISTFANIINDNFPTILMKGAELLGQLAIGLIQAIPTLIANIPQIIQAIVDALMAFQWLSLGKNIIKFLADGIKGMATHAKDAGKTILNAVRGAIQNLPTLLRDIGRTAMSGFSNVISTAWVAVKNAAGTVANAIIGTIKSIPGKMISIGKNIIKGLWNGISDMTGWIIDKIGGFADNVVNKICDFFGINSPSTVMRDEVGKYMAQGVGVGFEKNIPVKEMTASMKKAISDMQTAAIRVTSTMPMTAKVATKAVTNNYTNMAIDYREIEKAQLAAMNKANERPVILNNRQVTRARKNGGLVTA